MTSSTPKSEFRADQVYDLALTESSWVRWVCDDVDDIVAVHDGGPWH